MTNSVAYRAAEDAGHDGPTLPCIYCRGAIPSAAFLPVDGVPRLLCAPCHGCDRTMTLATQTWRRWTALAERQAARPAGFVAATPAWLRSEP